MELAGVLLFTERRLQGVLGPAELSSAPGLWLRPPPLSRCRFHCVGTASVRPEELIQHTLSCCYGII